jgi:hypothetical protein
MVAKHLSNISSLHIAAVALTLNAIPAILVLIYTDFFNLPLGNHDVLAGIGAATFLGVVGTAFATIIFLHFSKKGRWNICQYGYLRNSFYSYWVGNILWGSTRLAAGNLLVELSCLVCTGQTKKMYRL